MFYACLRVWQISPVLVCVPGLGNLFVTSLDKMNEAVTECMIPEDVSSARIQNEICDTCVELKGKQTSSVARSSLMCTS